MDFSENLDLASHLHKCDIVNVSEVDLSTGTLCLRRVTEKALFRPDSNLCSE